MHDISYHMRSTLSAEHPFVTVLDQYNNQYICFTINIEQLEPTYIRIFPVHLRMVPIFTDFPIGSAFQLCALLDISEYQSYPQKN